MAAKYHFSRSALLAPLLLLLACPPVAKPEPDAGGQVQPGDAAAVSDTGAPADAAAGTDTATGADTATGTDSATGTDRATGSDATTGPCLSADDCPAGQGCRSATGECDTCRVAAECRAGEACLEDGVCGPCADSPECNGILCDNGNCRACSAPADDGTCSAEYGDVDFVCDDSGTCSPPTCTHGSDCWLIGRVCGQDGTCEPCGGTPDCLEELRGEYPARTVCIEGICVEGDCTSSADCPADKPICGTDFRCRGCQMDPECLVREGVPTGYVCDLANGRCEAGDCYPPDAPCDDPSGGVCDAFTCRACDNPSGATVDDCQANGYPGSVLCAGGACVTAECNGVIACAGGRACDAFACVDCTITDDDYCTNSGQVCDTASKTCVECLDDPDCSGGQKICDDFLCRDCVLGECGDGRVCADGSCVAGNCDSPDDCGTPDPCKRWTCPANTCVEEDNDADNCTDGNPCTLNDYCFSGECQSGTSAPDCTHLDDECNTGVCNVVNSTTYECVASPQPVGTECTTDVYPCTLQECSGSSPRTCTLVGVVSNQCFIGGNCRADGFTNPDNECQRCDPIANQTDWSDKPVTAACTTDSLGCTEDHCDGGGTCVHTWDDTTSTCYEGGACFNQGADRASNQCEVCSGSNTWDAKTDGAACNDGNADTQHDICLARSCVDRFVPYSVGGCGGVIGTPRCIEDRLRNIIYFFPDGCPMTGDLQGAENYCCAETHANGPSGSMVVPTAERLEELVTATSSPGCSTSSPFIDKDIAARVSGSTAYWTRTPAPAGMFPYPCMGSMTVDAYTIKFDGASPTKSLTSRIYSRGIVCSKSLD